MLTRKFLAVLDDAHDAFIDNADLVLNTALAAKIQYRMIIARECHVTVA